ncbi:complement C1q subcomponent subunit A [Mastacembelus armatus]|uniref:Complement C1q subcomponent subunit A n=1 Tax=Mastacembelus armatus TaxID=205130 RepID=A0A3Q3MGN1_9TELE|nr:complement C1q subcomponent subunit C-like [Mastacembelus armatus]
MGGYYGLAVLLGVAFLVTTSHCDVQCRGVDGQAGISGTSGRDGLPGEKGQKGEPVATSDGPVDAAVLLMLKGEMGDRGMQGVMGAKGFRGDLGAPGQPGISGPPGPDGRSFESGQYSFEQARSAFSVMRTDTSYPRYNEKVTYQKAVVNKPGDFNIATGQFTCRVPGVYYFNFHSMAKVSMCLRIETDAPIDQKPAFCDYNRNYDQVLSGGVVLELEAGHRVWLVSFKDQQTDPTTRDTQEKLIIFNGFLIF